MWIDEHPDLALYLVGIKVRVREPLARRGIRKELARLKHGLRVLTEQTSQWFTIEHDKELRRSTFKPIYTSGPNEANLAGALKRSGLTMSEAERAYFQIEVLETLLGDTKEAIPSKDAVKV